MLWSHVTCVFYHTAVIIDDKEDMSRELNIWNLIFLFHRYRRYSEILQRRPGILWKDSFEILFRGAVL